MRRRFVRKKTSAGAKQGKSTDREAGLVATHRVGSSPEDKPTEIPLPLTDTEKQQFEQCENVLRLGLQTFFEVGSALLTIRKGLLYRVTHTRFEDYCRDRWGIGRSYAGRVIGAAERVKLLPAVEGLRKPANEFQMRPFLKLEPEAFPKVWEQVVERAKGGKITPSVVRQVIAEAAPRATKSEVTTSHSRRRRRRSLDHLGQVLTLLHEVRRRVAKGETDEVIAVLDRIESILFSVEERGKQFKSE